MWRQEEEAELERRVDSQQRDSSLRSPEVVTGFCDVKRKIGRMRPRPDGAAHRLSPKGQHVLNSGQKWPSRKKWRSSVARPPYFSKARGVSFFNNVDN